MSKKKHPVPPPKKQQVEIKKSPAVNPQPKPYVSSASSAFRSKAADAKSVSFIFGRINYFIMIGGLVLMAVGFILMIGGGSTDSKVFNPALFDSQRLTVAPLLVLLGLAAQVVAILKKPKA
jgi:hypothetical protein